MTNFFFLNNKSMTKINTGCSIKIDTLDSELQTLFKKMKKFWKNGFYDIKSKFEAEIYNICSKWRPFSQRQAATQFCMFWKTWFSIAVVMELIASVICNFKAASTLEQKCVRGRPRRGMRSNVDV